MDRLSESPMLVEPADYDGDDKQDVAIIQPLQLDDEEAEQPILADDYEAMKNLVLKELPDLKTEAEAVSTWNITSWRSLKRKEMGPVFECGGQPWRILFFPFGNNVDSASLYLMYAAEKPEPKWYACVQFALVMWNPEDPSIYAHLAATHRFTTEDSDWGFTRFAELRKLFASRWEDRDRGMVEDNRANISAYVRIVKDPTGVLWHNFINYDSKTETGYVGLKNQGATCYLNSLLQSLYFTNAFRKAVYQIPTKDDESLTNSAYALQRLFYLIQTSPDAVPTTELTRSFGWETRQIFEQQDVQELCRILMERMELKMKGTEAENALAKLFVGKTKTYISCINVDFESSRIEDFWDIQLTVAGNRNLDESFRDYIQVETMDGDNKYYAEGYGLQDAKKGVIFESFPQVLHLQLKRFEYVVDRDVTVKINDRYEFPEVFDASPYLSGDADRSEPWTYQLHGVLVHSGDFNAGHYYAFLKPTIDGDFYKFDDDRVTRATMKEVLEDNYGGYHMPNGSLSLRNPYTRTLSNKRSMSAYMLVYIRQSRLENVLVKVAEEDTPPHLQRRLDEERALREQRKRERDEQHLYLNIAVMTDETFRNFQGFDLGPVDADPEHDPASPRMYRVLKATTIREMTSRVATDLGQPSEKVRLWVVVSRQNKTLRPESCLDQPDMTVEDANSRHGAKFAGFRVWAEVAKDQPDGAPLWPDMSAQSNGNPPTLIFLKYFDVHAQSLKGAGHIYFPRRGKVSDLVAPILELMGWPEETQLDLFEEIMAGMIEPLKSAHTLLQAEIQDGDIICLQQSVSEEEKSAITQGGGYADARHFYDYLCNRLTVRFIPKVSGGGENESFELDLSKRMVYDQFAAKVGEHLQVKPTHLRFFTMNMANGSPKTVVKRNSLVTLNQILNPPTYNVGRPSNTLFYEVLDQSLSELETKKLLKLTWLSEDISKEESCEILVPKSGCVKDVALALEKKLSLPEGSSERIRVYEVQNFRIAKVLAPKYPVASISEYMPLYAEMIPGEEIEAGEKARTIDAFHYNRDTSRAHGVPFKFLVIPGEIFSKTKERLEKRIGVKGKQFEAIKFALVPRQTFARPSILNDDDILSDLVTANTQMHLGLDHVDRSKGPLSGRGDGIIIR